MSSFLRFDTAGLERKRMHIDEKLVECCRIVKPEKSLTWKDSFEDLKVKRSGECQIGGNVKIESSYRLL